MRTKQRQQDCRTTFLAPVLYKGTNRAGASENIASVTTYIMSPVIIST